MLNGLLVPTHGHVYLNDIEITKMSPAELRSMRQRTMSMVFQHFALFPHRSVMENAAYGLQVRGVGKTERFEKASHALGLVGLDGWENHLPQQLSGGMRQRVGLARALAVDTDVLLMDEAFSALDPLIRREMQDLLVSLQSRLAKTIIFITHDLNEAMRLGDRIAVMLEGRIVQIGTTWEILNHPADDYVARFVQDVDRTRVLSAKSVMEPPLVTANIADEPHMVLRAMHDSGSSLAFVVRDGNELVGVALEADTAGSSNTTIESAVSTEVTSVKCDMPAARLLALSARSRLPLAVIDERGRLLGVVSKTALLEGLGEGVEAASRLIESGDASVENAGTGGANV